MGFLLEWLVHIVLLDQGEAVIVIVEFVPEKPGLKPPQPEGGSRRDSFCARMTGMKKKLTSAKTAKDPNSRINKSLRAWNC